MRIIGIDYGTKRVGVAVGDTDHKMAFPKAVLKNDGALLAGIEELSDAEGAEAIVLGESKDFKGADNKIMEEVRAFKVLLEKELGLPVYLHPEFMTSAEAERLQGKNDQLDASAAALILKHYLNSN